MDRKHSRQPAHPALRRTVPIQALSGTARYLRHPEEAYAQAQKALIMLSSSLNKGIEKVESVQEATGKIQENVNEQLNRLNNIKQ